MAKYKTGPTGNAIQGHVLDCAKAPLERKLKEYDKQLYVRWNPKKLRGWGCWELRRKPDTKVIKETLLFHGNTYHNLEYKELNLVNHIMDIPFLNYNIIETVKSWDTWEKSSSMGFAHDYQYLEGKMLEAEEEKAHAEATYNAKQMKHEIRDLKELVLSGFNPARIADYWDQKQK